MKRIALYLLLSCWTFVLTAQTEESYMDLVKTEKQLHGMFEKLYGEEMPGMQLSLFLQIDSLFFSTLSKAESFNYSWKELDKIGKLQSEDGKVKIFSYLYMVNRNDYRYQAFIQVRKDKNKVEVFRLQPGNSTDIYFEEFKQSVDNWHGKIYYDLVTTTYKRKVFYTLIGADFKDSNSSLKTIEVVSIQRGKPVFRGDQFLSNGAVKDRVVLEFSADLAASVRYNTELKMIVHDHLAPLHPIYTGNFQFYGPDGSYDGFRFIDGIWVLEEDVDARNQ